MKSKMPSEFYIFISALALGAVCTLTCFIGTGLLSPALALSQSLALLAVCIMSLSFYSDKSRVAFLRASLFLLTLYFAFDLAVGNLLALLPLACAAVLFFTVKDARKNKRAVFDCLGRFCRRVYSLRRVEASSVFLPWGGHTGSGTWRNAHEIFRKQAFGYRIRGFFRSADNILHSRARLHHKNGKIILQAIPLGELLFFGKY